MQVTRVKLTDIDDASAKISVDSRKPYYELCFADEKSCSFITAMSGSSVKFDAAEKALRIETDAVKTPAMIMCENLVEQKIKVDEYPVIAFKVKRENYDKVFWGDCYFSTDHSVSDPDKWVKFKSPRYSYNPYFRDEYVTVAINLSKMINYYDYSKYPDNLKRFDGHWDGFKISFAKEGYNEYETAFYIKAVGFFKSFWDAWNYYS